MRPYYAAHIFRSFPILRIFATTAYRALECLRCGGSWVGTRISAPSRKALGCGADFVLLDVRGPAMFAKGHVPGAINLPQGKIIGSKMAQWPEGTLFVTYCAGPHCNGAARGALRLAELGRPVKIMPGGITGWIDEGFDLAAER